MSTLTINTTQNVNIDFTPASVGVRIVAFLVDSIIKYSYAIFVLYVNSKLRIINLNEGDTWEIMAKVIIILSPVFFYTLVFETLLEGQTPGKRLLKIKVVKIDGFQASFPDFAARWLMRIIDISTNGGAIALLSIIMSNKSQRLGDMVAGTAVISLNSKTTFGQTILMNLGEQYQPVFTQAAYLSDNDARIIKDNLERAMMSNDMELLYKLRQKVEDVLGVKKDFMTDDYFIRQVLADFNYYTGAQA